MTPDLKLCLWGISYALRCDSLSSEERAALSILRSAIDDERFIVTPDEYPSDAATPFAANH